MLTITKSTRILFFLLLSLAVQRVRSQPTDLQFEHITTLNGLSQDIVTCIHRDRFGYLWIGTEDGLNRYDGYTIKVYKHVPNDTSTLSSSWIKGICDFGEEDLLIITNQGISVYRSASDTFARQPKGSSMSMYKGYSSVIKDRFENYWMIQDNWSILKCTRDFIQVSEFDTRTSADSSTVSTLFLDSKGRVLAGTTSLLLIFDGNLSAPKVIHIQDPELPASVHLSIASIAEELPGIFWFGTNSGLYRYDEEAKSLQFVSLFESRSHPRGGRDLIFDLKWDHSNRLWAAGFNGLYCRDPKKKHSVRYASGQDTPDVERLSRVYTIYIDPAEILWVGTWGEGLNKTNLHKEQFGLLHHSRHTPFAGGRSEVSAIYEDPTGTLWLGDQNNGVTLVNSSMNIIDRWNPGDLSGRIISAITGDGAENVWIASNHDVLDWYNIRTKTMRHIYLPPTKGEKKAIFSMLHDPAGYLWIGTEARGVYRFDLQRKVFQQFGSESADSMYHPIKSAWSFFSDESKNLWIGGWVANGNLHRIDARSGALRSYAQPELSSARAVVGDEVGNLWVGTWGNGLTRFNPAGETMHNYTERDGLPSNYVKSILRDDRGNLWIGTEKGLSKFNPRTEVFRNYDISDGLQGNFFYSGSCFRGRSGKLYFGGSDGMNGFYPDSIRDIEYNAPVILTSFRVFDDQRFFKHSLGRTKQVELSYTDNLFAFEYVSLDYRAPARHQYAYMMEGFDNDWIRAGTRRYVSYTHLDPGEYVFKVKGTNSDGVWSPSPASIRVVIEPAFWQTWWFRTSVVIVIIVILYALYRYRINKLLELERTRSAIATDLHDDIGTSLTNIALFSDLAKRDVSVGSSEVTHRLEKISDTSRSLLDSMNDIVWSIKPENDGLEQTILRMEDYAVDLLEENGIDLHVQIPDELKTLKLPMTLRRNLFLIFKEAIGNILKHAKATHVDVTILSAVSSKGISALQVSIADNGRGFDSSAQRHGNGLTNMEFRAGNLGGTVTVRSVENQGTTVEILFPLKSPI